MGAMLTSAAFRMFAVLWGARVCKSRMALIDVAG